MVSVIFLTKTRLRCEALTCAQSSQVLRWQVFALHLCRSHSKQVVPSPSDFTFQSRILFSKDENVFLSSLGS